MAIENGKGEPVELVNVIQCEGTSDDRKCQLIDFDGSTAKATHFATIKGTTKAYSANPFTEAAVVTKGKIGDALEAVISWESSQAASSTAVESGQTADSTTNESPSSGSDAETTAKKTSVVTSVITSGTKTLTSTFTTLIRRSEPTATAAAVVVTKAPRPRR